MFWQRPLSDRALQKRLLELAGDPAFAQSPERQRKLAERSVKLVMEAAGEGHWDQALALAAATWRFELLALLSERMTPEDRSRMLVSWWTSFDGYIYHRRKEVLGWLAESGYIGSLPRPETPLTVYRGVGSPAHKLGLSWSVDADDARHFAVIAADPTGHVYSATAPPEAFMAGFEGLGPPAYVLDPRLLTAVSEVGKVRPDRTPTKGPYD